MGPNGLTWQCEERAYPVPGQRDRLQGDAGGEEGALQQSDQDRQLQRAHRAGAAALTQGGGSGC
eukprot:762790-Hanusia_phi.AAC.14